MRRRNSSALEKPARSIQRSSSLPARPENGRRDSRSAGPGACPTRKNGAPHSPEKVGLASGMMPASTHTWQPRHATWSFRSAAAVARGAMHGPYISHRGPVTSEAMGPTPQQVLDVLATIQDPDLGRDVVSLGMIKELDVSPQGKVSFTFELTTPACPVRDRFKTQAQDLVGDIPGVSEVEVRMTANVRPAFMRPKPSEILPGVKQTIAIASGKGGVGKSTVAVNIAAALRKAGAEVGLLDGHIYPGEQPTIYRGPMVGKAIEAMMVQVDWGRLDYLVIDLPPGTGDASLTLAQAVPLTGVAIVCTPQDVATDIAVKALQMFRKLNVTPLGLIENMSWYVCPSCGHRHEIFSHGGAEAAAQRLGVPFLGAIPLEESIREDADKGTPVVISRPDSAGARAFMEIASQVAARTSIQSFRQLPVINVR